MANLLTGKLPPPDGMSYQEFLEYSMYLALREFIYVYNGVEASKRFDESYNAGRSISQETVMQHPLGKMIAELGTAMHGGGVMPGWNNTTGQMNWLDFSKFVRWYAGLKQAQKVVALRRIREGSETPWQLLPEEQQRASLELQAQQEQQIQANLALANEQQIQQQQEQQAQSNGMSTLSMVLIAALVVGAGFLIYRSLNKATQEAKANPEGEEGEK